MKKYRVIIEKGISQDYLRTKEKIVFLCRHGETDAAKNKYYAFDDSPLNTQGLLDAKHIKQQLLNFGENFIVYTSPFVRATETADILSSDYTIMEELRERNYGNWKGKSKNEIHNETPFRYFLGKIFPGFISPIGGESLLKLYKRRDYLLDVIWNDIENHSVIITHGSVIHSLMMYPNKRLFGDYWRFTKLNRIECGEIYSLRIQKI